MRKVISVTGWSFADPRDPGNSPILPLACRCKVTHLVSENSIKWNCDPSSELPGPLECELLVEKGELFQEGVC